MVAFRKHAPLLQVVLVTHPPIQPVSRSGPSVQQSNRPTPTEALSQPGSRHCQRFLCSASSRFPRSNALSHRWVARVRVDHKWLPTDWRWLLAISSNPSVARKSCGPGFSDQVLIQWWYMVIHFVLVDTKVLWQHISFAPVSCWTAAIMANDPVEQNFRCVRNVFSIHRRIFQFGKVNRLKWRSFSGKYLGGSSHFRNTFGSIRLAI